MNDPRFDRAVDFTLEWETEYDSNGNVKTEHDPNDKGLATRYGIDQRSHPEININDLTLEDAKAIYYVSYWLKAKCDQLPDGFAEVVFDISVNNGVKKAITLLQRAVGTIIDGIIGENTLKAASLAGRLQLQSILVQREILYKNIAWNNPSQARFLKGWLNRNRSLSKFAFSLIA